MQPTLDKEDKWLWQARAWKSYRDCYFRAKINGKPVLLHRLIAGARGNELVDHINGDRLDNRRSNLRICDRTGSNQNRRRKRTSSAPYKGITQTPSGKWLAQIMADKQYVRIGLFETPEGAARAYDRKAIELHGEFARINGC